MKTCNKESQHWGVWEPLIWTQKFGYRSFQFVFCAITDVWSRKYVILPGVLGICVSMSVYWATHNHTKIIEHLSWVASYGRHHGDQQHEVITSWRWFILFHFLSYITSVQSSNSSVTCVSSLQYRWHEWCVLHLAYTRSSASSTVSQEGIWL